MSCERGLNFDQWKTFSENSKSMRVWLWLVYKLTESYCCLRLFSEFIQTQKRYPTFLDKHVPNWKTTCHIKLNFFLWTELLENLFLAKYPISVAAPLKYWKRSKFPVIVTWKHADLSNEGLFWKPLVLFFRRIYALPVGFKMKPLRWSIFQC